MSMRVVISYVLSPEAVYAVVRVSPSHLIQRRPIAHTCDCVLELPSTYMNYDDFYNEFLSIFDKVNEDDTYRIDAF